MTIHTPPCKGCSTRHFKCQSTCVAFQDWKAKEDEIKARAARERQTKADVFAGTTRRHEKYLKRQKYSGKK